VLPPIRRTVNTAYVNIVTKSTYTSTDKALNFLSMPASKVNMNLFRSNKHNSLNLLSGPQSRVQSRGRRDSRAIIQRLASLLEPRIRERRRQRNGRCPSLL
jgi:hypothetical protein